MGIRIGDYLKKDHKFSNKKLLKAMKLSGMLDGDAPYSLKLENYYRVPKNGIKTKMNTSKPGKNNNGQSKAA